MSFQFILPTLEELLKQIPACGPGLVAVLPEGRPLPAVRSFCVGIDEAGKASDGPTNQGDHMRQQHVVEVTISWRLGQVPSDRLGSIYTSHVIGLETVERAICDTVDGSHALRHAVIQRAGGKMEYLTPLYYQGTSRTRIAGPEWDGGAGEPTRAWAVRSLLFSGLLLVRSRQFTFNPLD